jgi:hypothetical protein
MSRTSLAPVQIGKGARDGAQGKSGAGRQVVPETLALPGSQKNRPACRHSGWRIWKSRRWKPPSLSFAPLSGNAVSGIVATTPSLAARCEARQRPEKSPRGALNITGSSARKLSVPVGLALDANLSHFFTPR